MKQKLQNSTDESVKMNLTLSKMFYNVLKEHAQKDYAKPATWTKQFLMKNLMNNKRDLKSKKQNETIKL